MNFQQVRKHEERNGFFDWVIDKINLFQHALDNHKVDFHKGRDSEHFVMALLWTLKRAGSALAHDYIYIDGSYTMRCVEFHSTDLYDLYLQALPLGFNICLTSVQHWSVQHLLKHCCIMLKDACQTASTSVSTNVELMLKPMLNWCWNQCWTNVETNVLNWCWNQCWTNVGTNVLNWCWNQCWTNVETNVLNWCWNQCWNRLRRSECLSLIENMNPFVWFLR